MFQVLYGMAEPVRNALRNIAGRVRLYCPYGEMIPGMAYLVRRLLENTSNESFLRQSFAEGEDAEKLLQNPQEKMKLFKPKKSERKVFPEVFENEPAVDFTLPGETHRFKKAIAQVRQQLNTKYPLFINGKKIYTDNLLESHNPNNSKEIVGRVSLASKDEVQMAISAAKNAFPAWRDTTVEARSEYLLKAADVAKKRIYELCAWQILEVGKQWDQAYADVTEAIDFLRYYAIEMRRLAKAMRLGNIPGEVNLQFYEPQGVASVIAPWNFPLAISMGMVSAAMATGNTVVYKPSGLSPIIGHNMVDIFHEVGIPAGVFNYLPGKGSEIGDLLVEHKDVSIIAFTGSKDVGLRIIEKASVVQSGQVHVKKVICEMGGKNAIIIDDDANLDEAIPAIIHSAFAFQGQKCSACSRLIVLDEIYDRTIERLVKAVESQKIGSPEDPANLMGAVIDAKAQKKIFEYQEIAAFEGTVIFKSKTQQSVGHFVPIMIVKGITPQHRIAQEEVFGPVLAVMRVKDFDHALEWANSTQYALTGGVFSRSPKNLERAKQEFRVGNLYLNRGCTGALVGRQPFGGSFMSGVGTKAGGPDYLLHFMHPRVVTENTMRRGFTPTEDLE
jgi:RHH-type proline utilization regulon transcriptional repressor/proline dehydrogenase/delta 1-pyrroline-5-carboxylate dehydrogenase